ncbi:competence protein ComJ [Xanthobacteraceae bacterium A53D]
MDGHGLDERGTHIAAFDLMVNYGQIIVHLPSVERPGHAWGDAELAQGFAWSPGLASFGVPHHAFMCRVNVSVAPAHTLAADAISSVRVPFAVTDGPVMVGSVFHYDPVDLPTGRYALVFETTPGVGTYRFEDEGEIIEGDYDFTAHLVFMPDQAEVFEILKMGGTVESDRVLSSLTATA